MINIEKIMPIYKVEHGCLLSAQGDITVAYRAVLPDIFTLSTADYETYHQSWVRAIQVLPKHSIVHKQDVFIQNRCEGMKAGKQSFLSAAADRHFKGRPFLDHSCTIMLTKKAEDRKATSSAFSGLLRKSLAPKQTTDNKLYLEFMEKAGQFECILADSGFIKLYRLGDDELTDIFQL